MAEARTYTDVPGLAFYPDSAFLWAVLICRTVLISGRQSSPGGSYLRAVICWAVLFSGRLSPGGGHLRAVLISGPLRSGSEGPIPAVVRDVPRPEK